jgi:purine-binding chemotaxis protein CheW
MKYQTMTNNWGDLPKQNLVAFRLGRQTYALPIEPIVQITEMVTITPVPQVSNTIEGVINVHGSTVPVINMRRHFGLPDTPLELNTPIILLQIGGQTVGLVVDEVIDVLSISNEQISSLAEILPEGLDDAPALRGLVHIQNATVLLLNPDRLLLPHQTHTLAQIVAPTSETAVEEVEEAAALPSLWEEGDTGTEAATLSGSRPDAAIEKTRTEEERTLTTTPADDSSRGA